MRKAKSNFDVRTCEQCGQQYDAKRGAQRFCRKKCLNDFYNKRMVAGLRGIETTCPNCSTRFMALPCVHKKEAIQISTPDA